MLNGKCITPCPAGTFKKGAFCLDCPNGCLECDSTGICTDCVPGYYKNQNGACLCLPTANNVPLFLLESDGKCYNPCPDGTIANSTTKICHPCKFPCKTC